MKNFLRELAKQSWGWFGKPAFVFSGHWLTWAQVKPYTIEPRFWCVEYLLAILRPELHHTSLGKQTGLRGAALSFSCYLKRKKKGGPVPLTRLEAQWGGAEKKNLSSCLMIGDLPG